MSIQHTCEAPAPRSPGALLLALLALTFATYAFTTAFGWVWDDWRQIATNTDLTWHNARFLLTHHQWASSSGTNDNDVRYFRPFLQLWLLINKSLFGLNPHWFHFTTVLAHVAASALVFVICRMLLGDASAALFATAIFALHPLQAETASWISDVDDSLLAIFSFASFIAYLKTAGAGKKLRVFWWTLSVFFFVFALLTKESAIAVPAVILLHLALRARQGQKPVLQTCWIPALVYSAVAVAWIAVRHHLLGRVALMNSSLKWSAVFYSGVRLLAFYLQKVVVPTRLSAHYEFVAVTDPHSLRFLIPLGVLVSLIVLTAVIAWRNKNILVAAAWILVPLAPALCIRWLNQGDPAHDRYMYVSMLGVALIAGMTYIFVRRHVSNSRVLQVVVIAIVAGLTVTSAIQSLYWSSDMMLLSHAVRISPTSAWAHHDLGGAMEAKGKLEQAEAEFATAYRLEPGWRSAKEAGDCFLSAGDLVQAESWYARVLVYNINLAPVWFNLGKIRLQQNKLKEAAQFFDQAVTLAPNAPAYHFALGVAYEQDHQIAKALEAYEGELRIQPQSAQVRIVVDRVRKLNSDAQLQFAAAKQ